VIVSSLEALTDTELEYSSVTFLLNSIEIMSSRFRDSS
jgi:hypothetical protein